MQELFPDIFKIPPSRITPRKYISFFVKRPAGNLLFPCFSTSSTIHDHFDWIDSQGGLARQLLGDSHFKTPHCDEVAERFNAPLYCSEPEAPDVTRRLQHVVVFPLTRHLLEPGVEVIPTPGHRPGGVCYLVTMGKRKFLFAGDAIWHNGEQWKAYPTKAGRGQMLESLRNLAEVDFDVVLANSMVSNPTCLLEVTGKTRRAFIDSIIEHL